ncbi:LysR substrate-binding domain-containing protein [Bordetella sp. 02P26C-1]|uniref:LysR substrate-binding domain-containing protein n=1 Tax=Bordetella sp. 02P26C-1 TaxID=2683195 RepID=UPI0013534DB6|nr:LysR substrate-binding domain-containing protein [Bordetella sp. 02P26C-1]MVW78272.1 LysR family transcriptional regulator [Bordetella sp. 02P26C-1]
MLTSMSRLPLNTLPAFRAVAQLQNLRAAAERLHLTHSAISQQIRGLEEQLGFDLFDRRGRRLVLNGAGETLLRHVQCALAQLDEGVQAAALVARGASQPLRVSVLPSFAQRWLLPRMGRWRQRHPELVLEIETSPQVADLYRDGFQAALRAGRGPWPGVVSEPLFDAPMPMIVLASPETARQLPDPRPETLARQPLLGDKEMWRQWFAAAGLSINVTPVASFNDAGLMLQAVEQGLGLGLGRELLAADSLCDGRLVKLSPISIDFEPTDTYHLVYPPALREWPPLQALRTWIRDELERSRENLTGPAAAPGTGETNASIATVGRNV